MLCLGLEEVSSVCLESGGCPAFGARRAFAGTTPWLVSAFKLLRAQWYLLGPLCPCATWAGALVPICLAGSAEKNCVHTKWLHRPQRPSRMFVDSGFLRKDRSARSTKRVHKICTKSTMTLFSTSYVCIMHIT